MAQQFHNFIIVEGDYRQVHRAAADMFLNPRYVWRKIVREIVDLGGTESGRAEWEFYSRGSPVDDIEELSAKFLGTVFTCEFLDVSAGGITKGKFKDGSVSDTSEEQVEWLGVDGNMVVITNFPTRSGKKVADLPFDWLPT